MQKLANREHVSGAGAENGAERARKPDERERSGERAESAAHNPLKPNNLLLLYVIIHPHSAVNFRISNSNTFFSVDFVSL